MDVQAIGVAVAGIITAAGGILLGLYTGHNKAKVDESTEEQKREAAEQLASRQRVELIAQDNVDLRKRIREIDDDYESRLRSARKDGQRGWDLAAIHFATIGVLAHLLRGLLLHVTLTNKDGDINVDRLVSSAQNAVIRLKEIDIPETLESPLLPKKELPA